MRAVITLLGNETRAHLVRYFLEFPGAQKDAAAHLGLTRKTVSEHVAVLVDVGVLTSEPADDRRSSTYRVDVDRLTELIDEPAAFFFGTSKQS